MSRGYYCFRAIMCLRSLVPVFLRGKSIVRPSHSTFVRARYRKQIWRYAAIFLQVLILLSLAMYFWNRPFLACMFCFPNSDHVIFSREFAFCLFIIMHTYAHGCTCIGRHLKETILCFTITRSVMGKQSMQAKKVFSINAKKLLAFFFSPLIRTPRGHTILSVFSGCS